MSFKEDLKTKIELDEILRRLVSTIKEPPGTRWVDKELTRELLTKTDFEYKKVRNLHLYTRPLDAETLEVLVLDNELPVYHTTVDDVALRKSPVWQEMFSVRNVRKIMKDQDVIISKGKESLKRLHASALARLDLTYTRDDLALLLEDAREGLERESKERIQEPLDLFLELLGFRFVSLATPDQNIRIYARPGPDSGDVSSFEHLLLFNERKLSLGLKKGPFSPKSDSDLEWIIRYVRGKEPADLDGLDVFKFLIDLALEKNTKMANSIINQSKSDM